ncbi:DNA phosphorothioation-associated putative methyltransferase [Thermodesulfobacteriota bacterium]
MDYVRYKKILSEFTTGKKLNDALYVYDHNLYSLSQELGNFVDNIKEKINLNTEYNVLKFTLSQFRISFLLYPTFFEMPHPRLQSSISVNLATGKTREYDYSRSDNPPILHRKETLLEPNHPQIPIFEALTEAEEAEGLYENTKIIGFKRNWEHLLYEKDLAYEGHNLIKITRKSNSKKSSAVKVDRHKTAISRYNISQPIQTILEHELVQDDSTIFDYGCGQGDDLRALQQMGYNVKGWDPVFRADEKKVESDIVNLGFVLNIIEDPIERTEELQNAFYLSKQLLVVSTMLTTANTSVQGRPYKDGTLTSRNTFQKYYTQNELRQYIEDVLHTSAVAVGPGIFYVFRDPVEQQDFLSKRNKRYINWEELSRKLYPARPERRRLIRKELYEKHKELLDSFWTRMLDLGRIPTEEEFDQYDELKENIGSPKKAKRFFLDKFGEDTLSEAFEFRKNDLLVYLALSNFKSKVPFGHLSTSLQADIKSFLGSYSRGLEQSKRMLFSIGDPQTIEELCAQTAFGYFDHKALYIHKSLLPGLHPILRIYVGCAGILYGDLENADIIKIHKRSGKVTLQKYDEFINNPLPELHERVKVNLRKQEIDVFDHKSGNRQQLLYFKENYVARDYPEKPKWEKLSKKLRKLGFDESMGFGPTKQEFLALLEEKNLTVNLNKKRDASK